MSQFCFLNRNIVQAKKIYYESFLLTFLAGVRQDSIHYLTILAKMYFWSTQLSQNLNFKKKFEFVFHLNNLPRNEVVFFL